MFCLVMCGAHVCPGDAHEAHVLPDGGRRAHVLPGDVHGTHALPGDARWDHVLPGDVHGTHALPGDARWDHVLPGDTHEAHVLPDGGRKAHVLPGDMHGAHVLPGGRHRAHVLPRERSDKDVFEVCPFDLVLPNLPNVFNILVTSKESQGLAAANVRKVLIEIRKSPWLQQKSIGYKLAAWDEFQQILRYHINALAMCFTKIDENPPILEEITRYFSNLTEIVQKQGDTACARAIATTKIQEILLRVDLLYSLMRRWNLRKQHRRSDKDVFEVCPFDLELPNLPNVFNILVTSKESQGLAAANVRKVLIEIRKSPWLQQKSIGYKLAAWDEFQQILRYHINALAMCFTKIDENPPILEEITRYFSNLTEIVQKQGDTACARAIATTKIQEILLRVDLLYSLMRRWNLRKQHRRSDKDVFEVCPFDLELPNLPNVFNILVTSKESQGLAAANVRKVLIEIRKSPWLQQKSIGYKLAAWDEFQQILRYHINALAMCFTKIDENPPILEEITRYFSNLTEIVQKQGDTACARAIATTKIQEILLRVDLLYSLMRRWNLRKQHRRSDKDVFEVCPFDLELPNLPNVFNILVTSKESQGLAAANVRKVLIEIRKSPWLQQKSIGYKLAAWDEFQQILRYHINALAMCFTKIDENPPILEEITRYFSNLTEIVQKQGDTACARAIATTKIQEILLRVDLLYSLMRRWNLRKQHRV
ncbi:uncharacterized protein LOC134566203 [Pelobates fuscus]|uniref:uncharacterized protein LOC134566203 n=1 Tax=Pelobates fuscus TaxID=191477 RepID=UPI002FE4EFAA